MCNPILLPFYCDLLIAKLLANNEYYGMTLNKYDLKRPSLLPSSGNYWLLMMMSYFIYLTKKLTIFIYLIGIDCTFQFHCLIPK